MISSLLVANVAHACGVVRWLVARMLRPPQADLSAPVGSVYDYDVRSANGFRPALPGRGALVGDKEVRVGAKPWSRCPALRMPRPPARVGSFVSGPRHDDPAAGLNQVLSEVIDAILDVRQADRRVPETQALHAVLGRLLADLRTWARLLADQDQALGVSPLASMPSGASRTPLNPWHGAASSEEVSRVVGEHLDRLGHYLAAALAEPQDDGVRTVLAEVERGVLAYRLALGDL
jgi:hypothetical protein